MRYTETDTETDDERSPVATRLEGVDLPQRGRYPWDEWCDGAMWQIKRGEDFDIRTERMQVQLHTQAGKRGLKVVTRTAGPVGAPDTLIFRFTPKGDE